MRFLFENLFNQLIKYINEEDSDYNSNIINFYEAFEIKKHLVIVLEPAENILSHYLEDKKKNLVDENFVLDIFRKIVNSYKNIHATDPNI